MWQVSCTVATPPTGPRYGREVAGADTKPTIRVLVTDLDNTLFDWFDIWTKSFAPMLDELVRITGIEQARLESQIREVHQRRRTSEYSGLLLEVPALIEFADGRPAKEVYASAIDRFRDGRAASMRLYDGVQNTLKSIKALGVPIVAYTESQAFYTALRMRWLQLDGLIDVLYSPADTDFPEGVSPEQMRSKAAEYYGLKQTAHRHTPDHALKPDAGVLSAIVDGLSATPSEVAYVGDSLMKDVTMAQLASVQDVWAKYGAAVQDRDDYKLLQRVSHWNDHDVQREKEIRQRPDVTATHTLEQSFAELLGLFDFRAV